MGDVALSPLLLHKEFAAAMRQGTVVPALHTPYDYDESFQK